MVVSAALAIFLKNSVRPFLYLGVVNSSLWGRNPPGFPATSFNKHCDPVKHIIGSLMRQRLPQPPACTWLNIGDKQMASKAAVSTALRFANHTIESPMPPAHEESSHWAARFSPLHRAKRLLQKSMSRPTSGTSR